jgi:DNA polymerase-4
MYSMGEVVHPRKIIHLDMDAFYASVEQRDDPTLKGRPLAVGGSPEGRGVVAAASYEARAFGVRSAMPMARAVRLCPELLIVRPDFAKYKAVSEDVMAILRSCSDLVEPLSLDEAYLDVTENRWGMSYASLVAKELKRRIFEKTRCTASAGVAPNKFLAKIASGWRKPDGLTVISPERVEDFLRELPVDALWGVGPVTAAKLHRLGIERVPDIRSIDPQRLHAEVGSLAEWLRRLSYGDDPREVVPHRAAKSASSETTYAEDLEDLDTVKSELARLARETAQWLQKKRLAGRTVTIKVRYADFTTVTRSHTLSRPTSDADVIASWATELLHRTHAGRRPVRLLGARVNNLVEEALLNR